MAQFKFDIVPLGEKSLLIQVCRDPSQELLSWLLAKRTRLAQVFQVEVIHTYNELLIKNLEFSIDNFEELKTKVSAQLHIEETAENIVSKQHRIPVCYHQDYAPDLLKYAETIKLDVSEIISLHTSPAYPIYFMGFLPGFPYLEGLNPKLYLDRKSTPSRAIPKGSVAIGGEQTGIYPQESPGGWHVIGRTPISLFNSEREAPCMFKAGDTITFYEISTAAFEEIKKSQN